MKFAGYALVLASVLLFGSLPSASAQVVIERRAIVTDSPIDLSIDRLLGPGILIRPGMVTRTVTMPRVLTHSAVISDSVMVSPVYTPGVYLPGRYSSVLDLSSVVLPIVDF